MIGRLAQYSLEELVLELNGRFFQWDFLRYIKEGSDDPNEIRVCFHSISELDFPVICIQSKEVSSERERMCWKLSLPMAMIPICA